MPGCKAHTAAAGHLLVTILHKIAIIVAGGSGKRAGTPIPKQFCDLDGNVFVYRAAAKETLAPEDTEEMTDSGWALTLFTCTTGGAYRLAIRCERAAAP